jgi:hypothetical protein
MAILTAIRREERKLEKELKHIQNRLKGISRCSESFEALNKSGSKNR